MLDKLGKKGVKLLEIATLALFLSVLPTQSLGQVASSKHAFTGPEQVEYLKNFFRVPKALLDEIWTTDQKKLRRNSVTAAVTMLTFASDQSIRDTWQEDIRSPTTDDISSTLGYTGSRAGGITILGSAYLYGLTSGHHHIRETAQLSAQAVLITQTIAGVKWLAGRKRPVDSVNDAWDWGNDDGHSFFSGHSSGVWSAAGVVAERYPDNKKLRLGVYSWATAVSLTRINEDAHWASDLLFGGLVGYGVGVTVARYDPFSSNSVYVLPSIDSDNGGVTLFARF